MHTHTHKAAQKRDEETEEECSGGGGSPRFMSTDVSGRSDQGDDELQMHTVVRSAGTSGQRPFSSSCYSGHSRPRQGNPAHHPT